MYELRKHETFKIIIIWEEDKTDSDLLRVYKIITGENFLFSPYTKTTLRKDLLTKLIFKSDNLEEVIGYAAMELM